MTLTHVWVASFPFFCYLAKRLYKAQVYVTKVRNFGCEEPVMSESSQCCWEGFGSGEKTLLSKSSAAKRCTLWYYLEIRHHGLAKSLHSGSREYQSYSSHRIRRSSFQAYQNSSLVRHVEQRNTHTRWPWVDGIKGFDETAVCPVSDQ